MNKPFVLSEDVEMLLRRWGKEKGYRLPSSAYFAGLLDALLRLLSKIFQPVELAEEVVISSTLHQWAVRSGGLQVSMDGVYFDSEYRIQVNRSVDKAGNDASLQPRPSAMTLADQVAAIRKTGVTEITLVDDVVFSGGQASIIIQAFRQAGVQVRHMLVGICIGEGFDRLAEIGVECRGVYYFPEVVDEICQRDFLPGTPRCGRYVAGTDKLALPYLLPFGLPGKWASIPEDHQRWFSRECMQLAYGLYKHIEQLSGRPVLCRDLDRLFPGCEPELTVNECLKVLL